MKYKLMNLTVLYLMLVGFLLFSCQIEENALMHDKSQQKFKVQQKSYKELMQTTVFNNAIGKLTSKSHASNLKSEQQGKTIMENQYGFTILDSPINLAETDEIISYSILVKSDSQTDNNYFENLVVNVNKLSNVLSAYLVKHKLAPISNQNNPNRSLIIAETTLKPITYNNSNLNAKIETTCHTLFIPMCQKPWEDSGEEEPFPYTAPHPLTSECLKDINYITVQEQQVCIDNFFLDDDAPTPIENTGTGNTNNQGGSTGTNNIIITATVPPPCRTCPTLGEDPCDKLNDKLNNTSIEAKTLKNKTNALTSPNITSLPKETGFAVVKINGTTTYPILNNPPGNPNAVSVAGVGAHYSVHVHMDSYTNSNGDTIITTPVPSPADFVGITLDHMANAISGGITPQDAGGLIVSSQGVYAIEINSSDIDYFKTIVPWRNMKNNFQDECDELYRSGNLTQNNLELVLLQKMREAGLENKMTLLKVSGFNSNQNPLASNLTFEKLVLNPEGTNFTKVPCN